MIPPTLWTLTLCKQITCKHVAMVEIHVVMGATTVELGATHVEGVVVVLHVTQSVIIATKRGISLVNVIKNNVMKPIKSCI